MAKVYNELDNLVFQLANTSNPLKLPKSARNNYSAATSWSTSEFPRKRKERSRDVEVSSKVGRSEEEESRKKAVKKDTENCGKKNEDTKPREQHSDNLIEVEANYNYRAPYNLVNEVDSQDSISSCNIGLEDSTMKIYANRTFLKKTRA